MDQVEWWVVISRCPRMSGHADRSFTVEQVQGRKCAQHPPPARRDLDEVTTGSDHDAVELPQSLLLQVRGSELSASADVSPQFLATQTEKAGSAPGAPCCLGSAAALTLLTSDQPVSYRHSQAPWSGSWIFPTKCSSRSGSTSTPSKGTRTSIQPDLQDTRWVICGRRDVLATRDDPCWLGYAQSLQGSAGQGWHQGAVARSCVRRCQGCCTLPMLPRTGRENAPRG